LRYQTGGLPLMLGTAASMVAFSALAASRLRREQVEAVTA
jgi:hypothetical protein